MQERRLPSLSREDPLEKEMATHSSILAWEIHGEMGLDGIILGSPKRVGHGLVIK